MELLQQEQEQGLDTVLDILHFNGHVQIMFLMYLSFVLVVEAVEVTILLVVKVVEVVVLHMEIILLLHLE